MEDFGGQIKKILVDENGEGSQLLLRMKKAISSAGIE